MTETVIRDATKVTLIAPPGGVLRSVKVRVEIEPRDGGALIYFAPTYDDPIRVVGPVVEVNIPTPEPDIYVQRISGAKSIRIVTLGYRNAGR